MTTRMERRLGLRNPMLLMEPEKMSRNSCRHLYMLLSYMKSGQLPYRLIYPQGKLPTSQNLVTCLCDCWGWVRVFCRGGKGVLDAMGAGREGRVCRGYFC